MIKLKETIGHLDSTVFKTLEDALIKNKADNFLYLLQSYRNGIKDAAIIASLGLNSNSFYFISSNTLLLYESSLKSFRSDTTPVIIFFILEKPFVLSTNLFNEMVLFSLAVFITIITVCLSSYLK